MRNCCSVELNVRSFINIKFIFLRSAGIGRSGTFCVVDCCLVLAEQQEENISIKDILLELRRGRMGLIQTHEQLKFSYEAVIEGIQRLENNVSNLKEIYSNSFFISPVVTPKTFDELNILEVCDENEEEEDAPPVPPRNASIPARNLPTPPSDSSSDSSESTSSDVSTLPSDDEEENENNFDANSKLPPLPNGKNDTSHDSQHEKERYVFHDSCISSLSTQLMIHCVYVHVVVPLTMHRMNCDTGSAMHATRR